MLAFANKLDFRYHCLTVEKRFVDSKEQIVAHLQHDMDMFFAQIIPIDELKFPAAILHGFYRCPVMPGHVSLR